MIHNFKYAFLTLLKNKTLIFWTFAFPILLGTFFQMAFQDIESSETLQVMDIAIIKSDTWENNLIWRTAFSKLSEEGSQEQLFHITYTNEEEALELLENDKIIGYLKLEETPKIVVKKSGIYQTVLKSVVEEIMEQEKMMQQGMQDANVYFEITQMVKEPQIKDISKAHLSYTMIEFYTLIAMTALYGGILGMYAVNQVLANMSANGKRIAVSPIAKAKLIISSAAASYVVQLIGIFLLFFYTIFVLNVDYGNQFLQIILLTLTGCAAGLSLGIMVASVFKTNENTKTGIILAVTMLGCFLSGMMGITMKYLVDKNVPIVNKVNPASMITDGFYALYYYDTLDRFYFNMISLLLFTFLMIFVSILCLRRQKYDSI